MYHHACLVCYVFLILSSLFTFSLSAQRLPVGESITIDDGLGFRDVSTIAQDANGLMWFGTKQGLNRYDGYRFVLFGNDHRADIPFPGESIKLESAFFLDDSTLYLISGKRLLSLNIHTFSYQEIGSMYGLTGEVLNIKRAHDKSIWIVWDNLEGQHLSRIDNRNQARVMASAKKGRREFTSLAIDTSGNAWWSTVTAGLMQISPEGDLLHEVKPDSFVWFGTTMYYTPLFIDKRNRIFVCPKSKNEFWQYHPETRTIDRLATNLPTVSGFPIEDQFGNIWFSSRMYLYRLDTKNKLTDFTKVLKDALGYSSIQAIFEDESNLMWVATDNGLVKFPNRKQLFDNHFDVPGSEWGNTMRGIFDDRQGRIYAYCEIGRTGLHRFDPATGKTEFIFILDPDYTDLEIFGGAYFFLADHPTNTFYALNDYLVQTQIDPIEPILNVPLQQDDKRYAHSILYKLANGQLLFGRLLSYLLKYDPATGQTSNFIKQPPAEFATTESKSVCEGPDGTVWIGTINNGLYQFDAAGNVLNHYLKETTPALSNNHILSLYAEGDSILWIGTFGGGLNQLTIRENKVNVFTQDDGLSNDNVTAILQDDEDNIWCSTYNGLSCYLRKEQIFRNYYKEDGLTHNEFNYASAFKDQQGKMWFGGMNGVQSFTPKDIISQQENPPLTWTGFLKYNRQEDSLDIEVWSGSHNETVTISPYDSYVQFAWTLPNYFKPEQSKYYVWLEGLEEDWSYIGHQPVIRYHKLPAGKYTLHIKGSDSKGNWSSQVLSIPIKVRPIFFKTWWFIVLILLTIGVLIYAFVHYRLQRLLEMERMRTRIAGDLHDEVGSMLSGLAMQAEIMELDHEKSNTARLHRISEISRMTLSKMRDVVWSIDSRRDQVKDLLDRMRENAEEMLTPKDIIFHFELGELPLEKKLPVDVRQHLFLFYKEAINNIAKHSNGNLVSIRFGQFAEYFELSIHDNGISPKTTPSSSGFGLQNLEMRARKLGATFLLNKENGFKVGLRMRSL